MGFEFSPNAVQRLQAHIREEFSDSLMKFDINKELTRLRLELRVRHQETDVYIANTLDWVEGLQVLVSSGLYTGYLQQNTGVGQRLMRVKIKWASEDGLPIMARVADSNERQKHILTKFGWVNISGEFWLYTPKSDRTYPLAYIG